MTTAINSITLKSPEGLEAMILDRGLILHSLSLPVNGIRRETVLGLDDPADYCSPHYLEEYPYLGAIIGRYANRISQASFDLNGKSYHLFNNNGPHCLHGGQIGFDRKRWTINQVSDHQLIAEYVSEDGEEGFPGSLSIKVAFMLQGLRLSMEVIASCDQDTPINLTYHPYFNLDLHKKTIENHQLVLNANRFLEQSDDLCPTGQILSVKSSPDRDFSTQQSLKQCVDSGGVDTSFVIDKPKEELGTAGKLIDTNNELEMEVLTTSPIVHVYAGQSLTPLQAERGKITKFSGFCLECQEYTDAVNHSNFPSTILKKGETYRQTTIYKFSVKQAY